jgi:hypothetical protein
MFFNRFRINLVDSVSPREDVPVSSLMTADCYCRGSDELDRRFKCRYTSVPYLIRNVGQELD